MKEKIIKLMESKNSGDIKLAKVYLLKFYPELKREVIDDNWGGRKILHLPLDAIEPVLGHEFKRKDESGSIWHGLIYYKEELCD